MQPGARECDGLGYENQACNDSSSSSGGSSGSNSSGSSDNSSSSSSIDAKSPSGSYTTIRANRGQCISNLGSAKNAGGVTIRNPVNVSSISFFGDDNCRQDEYTVQISGNNYSVPSQYRSDSKRGKLVGNEFKIDNLPVINTLGSIRLN